MSPKLQQYGIDRLSVAERVALVQEIWDSISQQAEGAPLSDEECAEVDRRLEAHRANPSAAIPREVVEAEARRRLSK